MDQSVESVSVSEGDEGVIHVNLRSSEMTNMSSFRDSTTFALTVMSTTRPTRVGRFEDHYGIIKGEAVIKEDSWSRVHVCQHKKKPQEQRIVKILQETCSYCHEYEMLRQLDHPNLPIVYELFQNPKTQHEFYMVLRQYQGESLVQYSLQQSQSQSSLLSEQDATTIMFQLLSCLNYLHHQRIVHCAVRPENVLFQRHPPPPHAAITLIDFSLSFPMMDDDKKMNYIRGNDQGHDMVYLAPEVLQDIPAYDSKADIWACGVLLYQLLTKSLPFIHTKDDREDAIRQRILDNTNATEALQFPDTVPPLAQDFIRQLLTHDANQRPTAAVALQHEWLAAQCQQVQDALLDENNNSHVLKILGHVRNYPNVIAARRKRQRQRTRHPQNNNTNGHSADNNNDPIDSNLDHSNKSLEENKHASRHAVFKLRQAICRLMAARFLSQDETHCLDLVFHALDTNHNGQLDPKELRAGYQRAYNDGQHNDLPDDDEMVQLWKQFQHDLQNNNNEEEEHADDMMHKQQQQQSAQDHVIFHDNRVLQYSEFKCAALEEEETLLTPERLKQAFQLLDKHHKRSVGVMELSDAFPDEFVQSHHLTMEDFVTIVDQVDNTGKGGIVYEDFVAMMTMQPPPKPTVRGSLLMERITELR